MHQNYIAAKGWKLFLKSTHTRQPDWLCLKNENFLCNHCNSYNNKKIYKESDIDMFHSSWDECNIDLLCSTFFNASLPKNNMKELCTTTTYGFSQNRCFYSIPLRIKGFNVSEWTSQKYYTFSTTDMHFQYMLWIHLHDIVHNSSHYKNITMFGFYEQASQPAS